MLSEDDLRDALRVCFDPELPVNIVDLGLVERVELARDIEAPGSEPRFYATVHLLRRTMDEQREAMLQAQVMNRLAGMPEVSGSLVEFLDEPRWTPERMTESARKQLGLDRAVRPDLVQIRLS